MFQLFNAMINAVRNRERSQLRLSQRKVFLLLCRSAAERERRLPRISFCPGIVINAVKSTNWNPLASHSSLNYVMTQ